MSQFLGMCYYEETELRQNGKPNIFGPEYKVVVMTICVEHGPDEAIFGCGDVGCVQEVFGK